MTVQAHEPSWCQLRVAYYRRKDVDVEMQARVDIERLRQEMSDEEFWGWIESEAPSLDEVFPKERVEVKDGQMGGGGRGNH